MNKLNNSIIEEYAKYKTEKLFELVDKNKDLYNKLDDRIKNEIKKNTMDKYISRMNDPKSSGYFKDSRRGLLLKISSTQVFLHNVLHICGTSFDSFFSDFFSNENPDDNNQLSTEEKETEFKDSVLEILNEILRNTENNSSTSVRKKRETTMTRIINTNMLLDYLKNNFITKIREIIDGRKEINELTQDSLLFCDKLVNYSSAGSNLQRIILKIVSRKKKSCISFWVEILLAMQVFILDFIVSLDEKKIAISEIIKNKFKFTIRYIKNYFFVNNIDLPDFDYNSNDFNTVANITISLFDSISCLDYKIDSNNLPYIYMNISLKKYDAVFFDAYKFSIAEESITKDYLNNIQSVVDSLRDRDA